MHPREPYSSQISFRKIGSCVAESPGLVAGGGATEAEHQTSPLGVSFQSLVGRLLARPASKNDSKFNISFLCLYRKFTAPLCLLTEIVQRFESATEGDDPGLLVLSSQMRYLDILQLWASYHPGDFAHEDVHAFLASFLSRLAMDAQFALAYKELTPFLHVVDDEDDYERIALGYSRSRASTLESFHSTSSTQSAVSTLTADSSTSDGGELTSPRKSSLSQTVHDSAPSVLDSASERSSSRSTGSSQVWLRTVEDARQQAHFLKPRPCYDLDKIRWHQLVDLPDDQIALELTRIDWIFYSSLRLRDLVRHSSLHPEAKERCKSLQYFSSMIQHFNHVALWTANMVLIRDKPKHRAVMLEKFMGISWRLRYMNNYNALGAILAGINGTAVHRLAQTRNLVSPEAKRQFMRLEILMGTARSHSAYRLAWQNTSGPRIPFLPLHQRDLVSAEAGNKTFLGNDAETCINWRKFEVMGDILMEIQESQAVPYPSIKRNEEILRLILGGKLVTDEDVSFDRLAQILPMDFADSVHLGTL